MTFAPFSQILIHSPSSLSPHPLPFTSSKGKFQGLAAQASCKTCSSQAGGGNKFQGEEGQATCNNECPQFTAPTSSQDACICVNPCPKGTFGSSPTCTDCPLGRYFVAGKKERRGVECKERESGRAEEDKSETRFFHAYAYLLPNVCNTKYILILPPSPHSTPILLLQTPQLERASRAIVASAPLEDGLTHLELRRSLRAKAARQARSAPS